MKQSDREKLLLRKLKEDIDILKSAINTLQYSYDKCKKIGIKTDYSLDELESFESLTSRFARLSDIITQKIFKTIVELSLEDIYTFIDRINYMEKLEIIESSTIFKEIRKIRNEISHEYIIEDLSELFEDVLEYSRILFQTVDRIEAFCTKNYFKSS